jgi:Right handed beta helix region
VNAVVVSVPVHTRPVRFCSAAALAIACAAAPTAAFATQREVRSAVLHVAAPAAGQGASPPRNGSADAPFETIAQALEAAPSGALIRIGEGTFAESLLLGRPVVLLGAGPTKTRIVGLSGARATAVRIRGDIQVELRDLAIEHAASGVTAAGGGLRLENVALRSLDESALVARDTRVVFLDGEVIDVGGGRTGVAVEIDGGSLEMRRTVIRAGGRRAIELRRGRAVLEALDVSHSSLAGLQAIDGAEASVEGGRFSGFGGSALYAGGAKLTVRRAVVTQAEYAVVGFRGARIELRDSEFADTRVASVGLVRAQGLLDHCVFARGGTDAAVAITETSGIVRLNGNRIVRPGPTGIHITHATVVATDNSIVGANLDRERDMGDAIYAVDSDLSLERNELRGNAGSGVTTVRSRVRLRDNRVVGNARAGVVLLDRSSASAHQNLFERNSGPGVQIAERSAATLFGNRFDGNAAYQVEAVCEGGGTVDVGAGNSFVGTAEPQRRCP